ncbi:AAA family ATPase [Actinocorallia sp. A-T 12471]|uniref:AAA family ATPase n=1 Tax=Actinocorallia sp. A-T 12471 TaxID=3089813 RepID=UPI0029CC3C1A|nr:AAA family ATPase [Actinocorallia sp. A-T 12471]MDX6740128.1 AAA family ATPase [Actinocorallia sp. A-T 12471]
MTTLIVVSGPPASGKTALARELALRLAVPYYGRDVIQEALFDGLGWSDRAHSRELGRASVTVLFAMLREALLAGADCVAESNFRRSISCPDLRALLEETGARAVQVQCGARGDVLLDRFTARAASPERHPGHRDTANIEEFRAELLAGSYAPLDIPGPLITLDTTDFTALDLTAITTQLNTLIRDDAPPLTSLSGERPQTPLTPHAR